MRIGIDIRLLDSHHRYRGIGVYLEALLRHLAMIDKHNEYVLFTAGTPMPLELPAQFRHQFVEIQPLPANLKQRLKVTYRPLGWNTDDWQVDIFLQPDLSNGLPRGRSRKVSVVYDLIPVLFQDYYYPRQTFGKAWLVQKLLLTAYKKQLLSYKELDSVIAISKSSKKDLLKFDPKLSTDSVEVIHLGIDTITSKHVKTAQAFKRPYFLYVGSCDYRKNVADTVMAFNLVKLKGYEGSLVLAGRDFLDAMPDELQDAIDRSPNKADIILPGFVTAEELRALYYGATGFVFASLYEGFGMPPLEAMANSCPVISYRNSSLPEVLDEAVLWAASPQQMAQCMIRFIDSPEERQKLTKRGIVQAAKFNWQTTAEKTLNLFERLSYGKDLN